MAGFLAGPLILSDSDDQSLDWLIQEFHGVWGLKGGMG